MWVIRWRERGGLHWNIPWDFSRDSPRRFKYVKDARQYARLSYGPFPKRAGSMNLLGGTTVEVIRESEEALKNVKCDSCMQWVSSCSCRQWRVS